MALRMLKSLWKKDDKKPNINRGMTPSPLYDHILRKIGVVKHKNKDNLINDKDDFTFIDYDNYFDLVAQFYNQNQANLINAINVLFINILHRIGHDADKLSRLKELFNQQIPKTVRPDDAKKIHTVQQKLKEGLDKANRSPSQEKLNEEQDDLIACIIKELIPELERVDLTNLQMYLLPLKNELAKKVISKDTVESLEAYVRNAKVLYAAIKKSMEQKQIEFLSHLFQSIDDDIINLEYHINQSKQEWGSQQKAKDEALKKINETIVSIKINEDFFLDIKELNFNDQQTSSHIFIKQVQAFFTQICDFREVYSTGPQFSKNVDTFINELNQVLLGDLNNKMTKSREINNKILAELKEATITNEMDEKASEVVLNNFARDFELVNQDIEEIVQIKKNIEEQFKEVVPAEFKSELTKCDGAINAIKETRNSIERELQEKHEQNKQKTTRFFTSKQFSNINGSTFQRMISELPKWESFKGLLAYANKTSPEKKQAITKFQKKVNKCQSLNELFELLSPQYLQSQLSIDSKKAALHKQLNSNTAEFGWGFFHTLKTGYRSKTEQWLHSLEQELIDYMNRNHNIKIVEPKEVDITRIYCFTCN